LAAPLVEAVAVVVAAGDQAEPVPEREAFGDRRALARRALRGEVVLDEVGIGRALRDEALRRAVLAVDLDERLARLEGTRRPFVDAADRILADPERVVGDGEDRRRGGVALLEPVEEGGERLDLERRRLLLAAVLAVARRALVGEVAPDHVAVRAGQGPF